MLSATSDVFDIFVLDGSHRRIVSERLVNLFDYEGRARELLPEVLFNMIYYGSADEVSTKRIRPAYESIGLVPRAMRGNIDSAPDTATTVLGTPIAFPVLPAAPGSKWYVNPDGELQTARAAADAGTVVVIPHITTYHSTFEDYAAAAPGAARWFQLYVLSDQGATREVVERAVASGCSAILLTVSAPTSHVRQPLARVEKNNTDIRLAIYRDQHFPDARTPGPEFVFDAAMDWSILEWLRSITELPLVVKGLLNPGDARIAVENGASGVLVSAHASRLFDGAITPIEALPRVADAVAGQCEVYLDGGVRTGVDVFKALAFGARACLIGKPLYYGVAVGGESGVRDIFRILRTELTGAMALCGIRSVDEIDRSMVRCPHVEGPWTG
jgi:isopentenyl diphosphate isomerase/L-lactate dehydrogenase-like FMN-dependent dehydrogenase